MTMKAISLIEEEIAIIKSMMLPDETLSSELIQNWQAALDELKAMEPSFKVGDTVLYRGDHWGIRDYVDCQHFYHLYSDGTTAYHVTEEELRPSP